ncbi:Uu.00g143720.m01.CDS01, partial [Anthostomella pinea]
MDLVLSFAHEVEAALAKGLKVSLATVDVQGAFDALLVRRLLERMRKQGWPLACLELIKSFLEKRKAKVRLERVSTDFKDIKCGTPQGSLWSPVLYMLYLAELLLQDPELRFGYADDLALYRVSKSLQQNAEMLADDLKQVMQWGDKNKVFFTPEKCKLVHITRSRDISNPSVVIGDHLIIDPVQEPEDSGKEPALRWLGVWINQKFTFKRHIQERAGKTMQLSRHIRNLTNT